MLFLTSYSLFSVFFFFNDPATTEIYTLSYTTLFRSGPASRPSPARRRGHGRTGRRRRPAPAAPGPRGCRRGPSASRSEEPRLNSSHMSISYAVFCLKKKKKNSTYNQLHKRTHHHSLY